MSPEQPEAERTYEPKQAQEDEDTQGGSRVRRAELNPDDFDIEDDRERGEPHLRDRKP